MEVRWRYRVVCDAGPSVEKPRLLASSQAWVIMLHAIVTKGDNKVAMQQDLGCRHVYMHCSRCVHIGEASKDLACGEYHIADMDNAIQGGKGG